MVEKRIKRIKIIGKPSMENLEKDEKNVIISVIYNQYLSYLNSKEKDKNWMLLISIFDGVVQKFTQLSKNRDIKIEIEYSDTETIDTNDFEVLWSALLDYYLKAKIEKE